MSNPGQFKDFNKSAGDLLSKIFPKKIGANSWGFEYELKPSSVFKNTAKLTSTNGVATGEIGAEVTIDDFGLVFNDSFKTENPSYEFGIKIDEELPVDGLSAKLKFSATGGEKSAQTGGVELKYKREQLTLNATLAVPVTKSFINFVNEDKLSGQDTTLNVDFVATHPDYKFYLGGKAKVIFVTEGGEQKVEDKHFKVGYRDGSSNFSIGFSATTKDDKETQALQGIVFTKSGETNFIGQLDYNITKQEPKLTLGAEYPLNDGSIVKIKADTTQTIGFGYKNTFSKGTTLSAGALLNVNNSGDDVQLSSGFNFNLKFTQ